MHPMLIGMLVNATKKISFSGTKAIREYLNKDKYINITCRRCDSQGPHIFVRLGKDPSPDSPTTGAFGNRIFLCNKCNYEMYADGSRIDVKLTDRIEAFVNCPDIITNEDNLQIMININQHELLKNLQEIINIKEALEIQKKEIESIKLFLSKSSNNRIQNLESL